MFKLLIITTAMMMLTSIVNGQDCPVARQEWSTCASPWPYNLTCSNYRDISCPLAHQCVTGCECPGRTVVNERTNSCVPVEDCPIGNLTCPAVTGPGPCVTDCNSDDDCDGNLLCCSNGCGQVCTEPVECAGVACPNNITNCSVAGVPAGECCATCGCTDTDGGFVKIGDTYWDECNTCTCLGDNSTYCTEGTCDCQVTGQVWSNCTSSCRVTCNNYNSIWCSLACVAGCECPGGGVINEETNSCIALENCPNARQVCPAVTGPGSCVIECNSDDECDGNLLCCSNGCGRVCTEPVECATVWCADIGCMVGGLPDGECCHDCGCTDTDGGFVKIGDTYRDDCNTCTCDGDNSTYCTEIACGGGATMVAIGYTWLITICVFISYLQYE